jgi:hypothetical protein
LLVGVQAATTDVAPAAVAAAVVGSSAGGGGGGGDGALVAMTDDGGSSGAPALALAALRVFSGLPRFALGVEFMGADGRGRVRALLNALEAGAPEEVGRLRGLYKAAA